MKIKFLHIRKLDNEENIHSHGGRTIAYQVDTQGIVWGYAEARCNETDNFVKSQGRVKAQGRLYSERYLKACQMTESDFRISMFGSVQY